MDEMIGASFVFVWNRVTSQGGVSSSSIAGLTDSHWLVPLVSRGGKLIIQSAVPTASTTAGTSGGHRLCCSQPQSAAAISSQLGAAGGAASASASAATATPSVRFPALRSTAGIYQSSRFSTVGSSSSSSSSCCGKIVAQPAAGSGKVLALPETQVLRSADCTLSLLPNLQLPLPPCCKYTFATATITGARCCCQHCHISPPSRAFLGPSSCTHQPAAAAARAAAISANTTLAGSSIPICSII
jgi:hypothetical protein